MKLERILQNQGFGSRRQCRQLVELGKVRIDGHIIDEPDADIPTTGLVFEVEGETWTYREKTYVALHKPAGFECSHEPKHHRSVYSLLPHPLVTRNVQSVGRLDVDTTGLLLFSDDGAFIHTLSSPKKHVPKVYRARLAEAGNEALLHSLLSGVSLLDEPRPVQALTARLLDEYTLEMSLDLGKYHVVKRMIAAAGNHVEHLHRHGFGGLALGEAPLASLAEGEWLYLEAADLQQLHPSA
ncbi:pseudouridine synthase [Zoogloea sp.]|uniref:pseudouridine synthase n=1 Tax=Zoogloea sp. TaxID=49181 RepID=UPI002635C195|nr:pseudouridine synthase [Zoogloea sp.]MDD3355042.1 pseudouridine synthase [Zoogloea sp.]